MLLTTEEPGVARLNGDYHHYCQLSLLERSKPEDDQFWLFTILDTDEEILL